jgi:hypothetical protein
MRSLTVVCAGQQINRIDLGSVDVRPVAAFLLLYRFPGERLLTPCALLAATRIAARMFAGPSGPASDGLRMAPVTTTGASEATSRSSR